MKVVKQNQLLQPHIGSTATRSPQSFKVVATLRTVKGRKESQSVITLPRIQEAIQTVFSPASKPTVKPSSKAAESTSFNTDLLALVGLSTAVAFICSIDRAAMSVAILPMSQQFDWDDGVKGAVSSAFFAGYMITNLTGGYLATRYSSKGILAIGVVMWSVFTVATPFAASSGSLTNLLAARGIMGIGEGVAYPSIQNLVRRWVPADSRSRALAFIYSGHQLGTVCSYVLAPLVIANFGWEAVFELFGLLGFVWLLGWIPLVKNEPDAKQARDIAIEGGEKIVAIESKAPQEPLKFTDVPWREFASSKPFWAIVAAQITVGCGSTLSFAWLPTFYSQVYGVDVTASAAFSVVPFLATVLATNAAGWIADGMVNNGVLSKTDTRKLMQAVASLGPAACLLKLAADQGGLGGGGTHAGSVTDAVVMVTAWLALGGFSAAGYGANHQDISSRWAGVLFGLSNGLASVAGSASVLATGMVLHETHDWSLIFTGAAALYLVGAGAYLAWGSADQQFE